MSAPAAYRQQPLALLLLPPQGNTPSLTDMGHRYIADLVIHHLHAILTAAEAHAASGAQLAQPPLPPPVLRMAVPLRAEQCLVDGRLKAAVHSMQGFAWEDQGVRPGQPLLRAVASSPGARLELVVDTNVPYTPADVNDPPSIIRQAAALEITAAFLWHTNSANWTSIVNLTCGGGCMCFNQTVRSHIHPQLGHQDHLHLFMISRGDSCRIIVDTLDAESNG